MQLKGSNCYRIERLTTIHQAIDLFKSPNQQIQMAHRIGFSTSALNFQGPMSINLLYHAEERTADIMIDHPLTSSFCSTRWWYCQTNLGHDKHRSYFVANINNQPGTIRDQVKGHKFPWNISSNYMVQPGFNLKGYLLSRCRMRKCPVKADFPIWDQLRRPIFPPKVLIRLGYSSHSIKTCLFSPGYAHVHDFVIVMWRTDPSRVNCKSYLNGSSVILITSTHRLQAEKSFFTVIIG